MQKNTNKTTCKLEHKVRPTDQLNYRQLLKDTYEARKQLNQSYSLRSFAKDLGLASTRMSDILNYKQGLSKNLAEQVADRAGFSHKLKELFVTMIEAEHARAPKARTEAQKRLEQMAFSDDYGLDLELFKVISDWQHMAIIELLKQPNSEHNSRWVAKELNITQELAAISIQRLLDVGLLKQSRGRYVSTDKVIATPVDVKSLAVQKYHSQILLKAIEAIKLQHVLKRDFSTMNFSISEEQLPEAKKMILEFRRNFMKHLESGEKRNKLYNLSIQFFSLQNQGDQNENNS